MNRASARQPGQTLDHEILSRAKEVRLAAVTSAHGCRPQVVRLQMKGELKWLSRAYFSLPNNIWSIALLYGAEKIASFLP